nr:DEAD/DEAH box helicase [Deinococcus budaensis]
MSWPPELAPILYRAVLERFEAELGGSGTVREVPLVPGRLQPPLDLPQFVPVDQGSAPATRPGRSVPLEALGLHPPVAQALRTRVGPDGLYLHQALALKYLRAARREGTDLILSTPTASGKTLSFLPGILEDLTRHGGGALFLYPLTALCRDQFDTISGVVAALPAQDRLTLKPFMGDDRLGETDGTPHLLVATPDKLNHNLHRPEIRAFLAGLKYVVLDEAHTYRGAFGTHMSAFLRRLLAVSRARPALVVSSATLKNTVAFARNLTGRHRFRVVGASTAPVYPRHLYLAPLPRASSRALQAHQRAVRNLGHAVRERHSKGLVFVGSRGGTRHLAGLLKERGDPKDPPVVFPFHSNMKEYGERLEHLRRGTGPVVAVSTSTLEAGIDIGDLELVGILGFPRTRNSFKQMAGRAGRGGTAHVAFLPGTGPADEYYSRPESLLRLVTVESEPVHLNPHNAVLLHDHLRRARYEMAQAHDECGPALLERLYPEVLPEDLAAALGDVFDGPPAAFPAPSLRGEAGRPHLVIRTGMDGDHDMSVPVVQLPDDAPDWMVERSGLDNAHREWGPGSVVLRGDRFYRVLDWKSGEVTERNRTAPAVLVWVEDITERVADPVAVARARRGLSALPPGAAMPHVHQAFLSSSVTIGTVLSQVDGEFVAARAGRGQVTTALRDKRERSEQQVTSRCPRASRARPLLPADPPERFHVTLRGEAGEERLGTYGRDRWPVWQSGRAEVPGGAPHLRQYHVVEEVRREGGVPELVVQLHAHDAEIPGTCACGADTEPRLSWSSSLEAVPDGWFDHPVFSMVPRTFETDVAEITLRGASLPALQAAAAALVKALPDVLEVDPQELGVHAVSEHGEARLLLWDTTVGGTGVSTAVPGALEGLLRGARTLLEEADRCVCQGAGCFGCIQPLTPLFWSHVPAPPELDEDEQPHAAAATDAALAFLVPLLAPPGEPERPATGETSGAVPSLPDKLPFTQLLLGLDALVDPATGEPVAEAEGVLAVLLSSRLDVSVVTELPHHRAAELLERLFPAHAPRLVGTLVAGLRPGASEPVRHLVPSARPERVLWLATRAAELQAAQALGVSSALALWAQEGRALETGPDLLVTAPRALLDAVVRPAWHAWPLEQTGLPAGERAAPLLVQHDVLGESLDVLVLGRYAPARTAARHNRLRLANQHAQSFKSYGTQAAQVADLIRDRFPGHLVALVPSSQEDGELGRGLGVLERSLLAAGQPTLRLTWARTPRARQKASGGLQGRVNNVSGCLAPPPGMVGGQPVLVVDDVVTTGATLREARRVLREAGAEVSCLAVAHTLLDTRGRA